MVDYIWISKYMKKIIAIFLTLILFFTSFLPFLETPLTPQKAYAKENCIYYVYDGQGNVRFLTNNTGGKITSLEYDPFGNFRSALGTGTNYLYQAQQKDAESSLYYLRARYYDPLIGRFISRDPVKGVLTNPQSQNPYAYSLNNPINLSDPSGEFPWLYALDAAGTALDAASLANDLSNCNWGGAAVSAVGLAIPFVSVGGIKLVGQAANVVDNVVDATKQFHILSKGEIEMLERAGKDIHALKKGSSGTDLFKDPKTGDIYVKPKSGSGPGEPTGLNINDFK